ncbi:protein phosphatase 2C domain-containing protein [Streptomyces sp. NBC_00989]|uniref:protein phosphatase 2C domain-containing protein n=1 Tax=Streptomyces sp. NBC_00989 TaxID=2903705 RepID=UPI00386B7F40|nr:protein phosphatase 2C domain-containing protein [Streptomyces sp. NBC_00989]
MSQQGGTPTGHEDDWWSQLYDDTAEDTGPSAAADSVDDRFASAAGTVGGPPADERGRPAGVPVPSADEQGRLAGVPPADQGARPVGVPSVDEGVRSVGPGVPGPRARAGTDSEPFNGAGSDSQSPTTPAPPADDPAVAPEDPRPDGPRLYPQPPTTPARPADNPTVALEDPRPDGPSGPRPFPQLPTAPARPADNPTLAPEDPRPDSLSAPRPYPQPPTTPAPPAVAPQPLRPDRPFDPRPYPQPSAVPAAPADNPSLTAPPLPIAPPPNLPALAPPPPPTAPPPAPLTLDYVGSGPPTYDAEPTALPLADPDELDDLVADTVLDGARYGASTIRAASVRGDSARFRGEPRRDSLLTARFGVGEQALVLVAMATGARATPGAHRAAAEACDWIARAVGRSHARLSEDIRAARRGDLKSGLHRLTDRSLGKLRASAAEQGIDPEEYSAGLRCLLLPAHPECRTRVFFGVGPGGLFRLRDGEWQDIEPTVGDLSGEAVLGFGSQPAETPEGDRLTMDLGIPTPPSPYEPAPEPPREPFRFRASVARPGDTLLMCTGGLAEPLRGEPELSAHLAGRWSGATPPGLAAFLADTQVRVKGYADDRTAAAVWEA